jgi:glucokinase
MSISGRCKQELGLERVTLLNDVQAMATAVPYLHPGELHTL